MRTKIFSLTLLLLLGFIWGTGYSIAHYAMTHSVAPLGYGFWQSMGPAILLLFIIFLKKNRLTTPVKTQSIYLYYLICGLMGIVIPNSVMYFSAARLPAGLLAVIVNTVPIMTYPLALIFGREIFHPLRGMGVLCAMIGLLCILIPHNHLITVNTLPWVLIALLAPLSFSCCAIFCCSNFSAKKH